MALTWQGWIMSVYLLICWSHTSFCTPPPYQSGSCCRYSLRTRTGRKRWPACHSTSGYYSPDMCPGPKPSHSEGLVVQSLQDKVSHDGKNKVRSRKKNLEKYFYSFDGTNPTSKFSAICWGNICLFTGRSRFYEKYPRCIKNNWPPYSSPTWPHYWACQSQSTYHKSGARLSQIQGHTGFSRKTMIKESLDPRLCCKHTGLELQWTSQQIWSGVSDQTLTKPKSHKKWKSWLITCGLLMLWSELLEIYSSEDIISRFPDPVWRRVLPRHRLTLCFSQ